VKLTFGWGKDGYFEDAKNLQKLQLCSCIKFFCFEHESKLFV